MTWTLALMATVGLVAGILNVAAAGGSLLPFLAMTVILGMPPLVANATTLAATPASFVRVIGDLKDTPRIMRIPLACAAAGTILGVWTISHVVTETGFRHAVPVLLIIAVALLLGFRQVKEWIDARTKRPHTSPPPNVIALSVGIIVTSTYAGAFGGSVGVMVLALLTATTAWPWNRVNTTKNIICLTTSVVGFAAFAPTGLVDWPLCTVLAASMIVGGFVGQWVTRVVSARTLRLLVAAVTTLSAAYLWTTP